MSEEYYFEKIEDYFYDKMQTKIDSDVMKKLQLNLNMTNKQFDEYLDDITEEELFDSQMYLDLEYEVICDKIRNFMKNTKYTSLNELYHNIGIKYDYDDFNDEHSIINIKKRKFHNRNFDPSLMYKSPKFTKNKKQIIHLY